MKHTNGGAAVLIGLAVVLSIALDVCAVYVTFNSRHMADQFRVWNDKPSAAVVEQIRRDDLSDEGAFLYLASFPKVESKRDFNQICSAVTTDTSILGCYIEASKRIYLFHVTDKRLDGTEEVMGAHEMLRAAWDRLSASERAPLLVQLRRVRDAGVYPDLDLSKRMATIRRNDPADYDAELYATVGSEVPIVGTVLEASYARYFVKRSVVTALNAHAISYLIALRHKVETLVRTMNTLGDAIDGQVTTFNADVASFETDVDAFNSRARRPGGFTTRAQFNAARAALVDRDNALEARVTQINAQVDVYNADLTKLKALDKTALSLVKSLNIELEPLPDVLSA